MTGRFGAVDEKLATRAANRLGAVILGGAHGSLAVARSLGRRGIPVCFITHDHPIARFSRYTGRNLTWHGPDHDGALAELLDLTARYRLDGWVLFPGGDAEVMFVARNHAALSGAFQLTTPAWEVARYALDKRRLQEHAAALGVSSPWSLYAEHEDDLGKAAGHFPVIVKPTIWQRPNTLTAAKAWRADSAEELLLLYQRAVALLGSQGIVVQELIPGGGEAQFSYAGLWDCGTPVASLVARRTRQYPLQFGFTSTFVETIERPEIEEAASRFLRALNYSGMVEAEFKYDVRDGRYKLLDVNARPWTWTALGAAAGADFPYLQWRLATGQSVQSVRATPGRAWAYASRDLLAGFQLMARRQLSLSAYCRSWRQAVTFAAIAADDPLPGLIDLPLAVIRVLRRRIFVLRERPAGTAMPTRAHDSAQRP